MTASHRLPHAAALALIVATAAGAPPALAQEVSTAELLAQIQALKAQVEALEARVQAQAPQPAPPPAPRPVAEIAPSRPSPAPAPELKVAFDGAPRITVGSSSLKLRGRLSIDAIWQDIDRADPLRSVDVAQIRGRQAFFGVEGNIGPQWFYKVEGGAVNGGGWSWDDAYLEYRNGANAVLVGNQKGVGLENLTSSRFPSFIDRGPMDNLIDASYHLGVHYWRVGSNYSFNAGVTGASLNSIDISPGPGSTGFNERLTASARATVAPIKTEDTVVHLGAWTRWRKRGDDGAFTYAVGYNSPLRVQTLLTTGAVGHKDLGVGLEGALAHRSFSLQGEVVNMRVDAPPGVIGGSPDLRAGYLFASFFATGETRAYNARGEFGRTRVRKPLGDGGFGSLELLARYDFADFSDALAPGGARLVNGGTYDAFTLGLTWQPINYVRVMANYTRGEVDNVGLGADADIDVFQVRTQIDW
jgi:phosphate-selective porin OprO/OprP